MRRLSIKLPMSQAQILLMIGDDGIAVVPYRTIDGDPFFVPFDDKEGLQDIASFIAHYPEARLTLCADNLAQDYRGDNLPRLNYFDRRKLMARRLKQNFPLARLTACLRFRKSSGRVLMIGLHESNPVFGWADRLRDRLPSILLLPVEGARMAARLMPEAANGWSMLISRQRTGGFRQIVTYKNDLVFTRLTPLPVSDSVDDIVATIAADIKASLDYLTRHGLRDPQELSVLLLAPEGLHEHGQLVDLRLKAVRSLSPRAAAQALSLPFAPTPDDKMADLVFAGYILSRLRPALSLMLPQAREIWRTNIIKQGGLGVACVSLAVVLLNGFWHAGNLVTTLYQTQQQALHLQESKQALAETQANAAPVTEPLGRMRQALERRHIYEQRQPMPWRGLDELANGLSINDKIVKLEWKKEADAAPALFSLSLRVASNADESDRSATVAAFSAAVQNIAQAMPDYTMSIVKPPYPALPQEAVTATAATESNDPVGEITLQEKSND